jgi:hypothetical protein
MAMSTIDPIKDQEGLRQYLRKEKPNPSVDAFVFHHCYRPNQAQYNGRSTVLGVKQFHMQSRELIASLADGARGEVVMLAKEFIEGFGFDGLANDLMDELQYDVLGDGERGFADIAANLYATPESAVKWYTARPLSTRNGAHAYISKEWKDVPQHARRLCGSDRQYFNERGFGLEMIADFTSEPYKNMPQVLRNGILAAVTVLDFYDLPTSNVIVHSDVAYKNCPAIGREFLMKEIEKVRKGKVDVDEYAKPSVDWAKQNGIMSGYNDQEFGGQDPIKRQDACIVFKRVFDKLSARIATLESVVKEMKKS